MATRDPLLSNLKGILSRLKEAQQPIRDSNADLQSLCETLESILRKGLKRPGSVFGLYKRDYWCWMESLLQSQGDNRLNPMFSLAIEACKTSHKVRGHQGRGRLLLRICLHKRILGVPIDALLKNKRMLETWYDPLTSIIGSELLVESLTSLLFWSSQVQFDLSIKNASFLDETWTLPVYKQYEFVPCKDLGLIIKHINQRVYVAEVKPDSVVAHRDRIEPGDILDELYGESLYGNNKGSKIPSMMKHHDAWPVYVSVIKCHLRTGKVFYNLKQHLAILHDEYPGFKAPVDRDPTLRQKSSEDEEEDEENVSHKLSGSSVHKVKYVGCTDVGRVGGTSVIEGAISRVLKEKGPNSTTYKDIYLEVGETNLITWEPTDNVFIKHSYPEISSCGRRLDALLYFAYVAGDTTCTISKQFKCYVYFATCDKQSKQILTSMTQGFGRTTWFV